ncbi:MAG TPA: NYN domain-containing protein [Longimicrobium sp.]|jgi:uncharacterized LabA/DUF88 family protein|uniref:NYN domain-containing protein n=1 Tax=Longimicrobium sp. TaxID=2029185 RepID=UPI002ED7CEF0
MPDSSLVVPSEGTTSGPAQVRVEIFVDGSNFHPSTESAGIEHPVAFGRLATELTSAVGGTVLVGLHYVAGAYPEPRDNDPRMEPGEYHARLGRKRSTDQLYNRIAQEPGVKVWRERFVYRTPDEKDSRPIVEKGADVRLALLMYEGAVHDRYDVGVLVASDADFGPAVEMVRALGKRVVWACTATHRAVKALVRKGAEPFEMTADFLERCRYVPSTPTGKARGIKGRV